MLKEECFIRYPNTNKCVEKTRPAEFFNQFRSVWISDEALFRVSDMASESINNSLRKSKQKFTECYDKLGSQILTSFMVVIFFVFSSRIIDEFEKCISNC